MKNIQTLNFLVVFFLLQLSRNLIQIDNWRDSLYQKTLQSLSMLLQLFVCILKNIDIMENLFANFCVKGGIEDTQYKLLFVIQTTKYMLDFCKKPGYRYPLKVILIEQRLLKSRKLMFQEYHDTLYPVLKYVFEA